MRFQDKYGNVEKLDGARNHFINGKCVNPKSWEPTDIGDTFSSIGLEEFPIEHEIIVTGHVSEFDYYDRDKRMVVHINTQV